MTNKITFQMLTPVLFNAEVNSDQMLSDKTLRAAESWAKGLGNDQKNYLKVLVDGEEKDWIVVEFVPRASFYRQKDIGEVNDRADKIESIMEWPEDNWNGVLHSANKLAIHVCCGVPELPLPTFYCPKHSKDLIVSWDDVSRGLEIEVKFSDDTASLSCRDKQFNQIGMTFTREPKSIGWSDDEISEITSMIGVFYKHSKP